MKSARVYVSELTMGVSMQAKHVELDGLSSADVEKKFGELLSSSA